MKITEKMHEELMKPIPSGATYARKKGGVELTYVDTAYVLGRLCEIFGPTGWSHTVQDLTCVVTKPTTLKNGKDAFQVTYRCTATITIDVSEGATDWNSMTKSDVGFGHGISTDEGEAHESAGKEAVTDALKRCARMLGWNTGLDLYRKDWGERREPTADRSQKTGVPIEVVLDTLCEMFSSGKIEEAKAVARKQFALYSSEDQEKIVALVKEKEKDNGQQ